MSESESEPGIRDEDLPDDLQPGEENPLADGLTEERLRQGDGPDRDDLEVEGGGRRPEQSEDTDDGESGDEEESG